MAHPLRRWFGPHGRGAPSCWATRRPSRSSRSLSSANGTRGAPSLKLDIIWIHPLKSPSTQLPYFHNGRREVHLGRRGKGQTACRPYACYLKLTFTDRRRIEAEARRRRWRTDRSTDRRRQQSARAEHYSSRDRAAEGRCDRRDLHHHAQIQVCPS